MTGFLPTTGIFVASAPVDLRKAFDGLAILVRNSLAHDPLDGSLYVFSNRRRDRIKILFWEPGGYWLCTRRLEKGTFRWPMQDEPVARYTREELTLLLGGIDLAQTRPLALHEVSADAERRGLFETLLAEEHYLGYRSAVGENLKDLLCQEDGRPLAAWLFGAAASRCEARDRWT